MTCRPVLSVVELESELVLLQVYDHPTIPGLFGACLPAIGGLQVLSSFRQYVINSLYSKRKTSLRSHSMIEGRGIRKVGKMWKCSPELDSRQESSNFPRLRDTSLAKQKGRRGARPTRGHVGPSAPSAPSHQPRRGSAPLRESAGARSPSTRDR